MYFNSIDVYMELCCIDNERDRELIASTILSYHQDTHGLKYDPIRQEFAVLGLGSEPDHMMARHAVMALGARECQTGGGRVIVTAEDGATAVAKKVMDLGLRFRGMEELNAHGVRR